MFSDGSSDGGAVGGGTCYDAGGWDRGEDCLGELGGAAEIEDWCVVVRQEGGQQPGPDISGAA